jgi:hypothetical protein
MALEPNERPASFACVTPALEIVVMKPHYATALTLSVGLGLSGWVSRLSLEWSFWDWFGFGLVVLVVVIVGIGFVGLAKTVRN